MSLKIIGTGKGIPEKVITNEDLSAFLETSDEWIVSRTGIRKRHVCTREHLTDLAETAALEAMNSAGITAGDIDLLICSTIGGDYRTPSLACCLAERLGFGCACFDLNAACVGFIYALDAASRYLQTGCRNVLIVCAEMMSRFVDWNDRSVCVLFGDGASACAVTKGEALKYLHITTKGEHSHLNLPLGTGNSPFIGSRKENGFLHMDGQEVFKFAVNAIEEEWKLALEALKISPGEIDYFVLHQANKRIIDFAGSRLRQGEEKFPVNIEKYGNISSASIPLLIGEMLESGQIKPGTALFMAAFGAGMTSGSCVMIWE